MPMRLRGSESGCSYSDKFFYLTEIRTLAINISIYHRTYSDALTTMLHGSKVA
jgi:hypothetical protein